MRNNFIYGRIPQILPCTHLICGDCINNMASVKIITCKPCKLNIELEVTTNLRDKFPIDRYALGGLLKQNISERSVKGFDDDRRAERHHIFPSFRPAGASLQNRNMKNTMRNPSRILTQTEHIAPMQKTENSGEFRILY